MADAKIRIIGIGNPLMGDDGIGIAAIERLAGEKLPPEVELVDGGCGGLTLLQLFEDCQRAIIIDAADFRAEPGALRILRDPDLAHPPYSQSSQLSHQPGLQEVLNLGRNLGQLPPVTLILVQVESCQPQGQLSGKVQAVLPELVRSVFDEIAGNKADRKNINKLKSNQ